MITLTEKSKCTGCAACAQVCAAGAISMKSSKEGFSFPEIDGSRCVACSKCVKVCPVSLPAVKKQPVQVIAASAKDEAVLAVSSSGGVFSLLAGKVISHSGVVYGAGFDHKFDVVHKPVDKKEDISLLTGSKYVQSDIGSAYKSVKADLKSGRQVLFAGTPCQCGGLKAFLNKEYENLLTVDFVCHGVPSPALYRKYLQSMASGRKITCVNFRCKTKGCKGYRMGMDFADGEPYRSTVAQDPYLLAYSQNISLRESCYKCSFKNFNTESDLTLGDFWGIEDTDSFLAKKDGVSLVLINTEKGRRIFEDIEELETDHRHLEEALKKNPSIMAGVRKNPLREKYLRDMNKMDIKKLTDKYCGNSYTAKLRRFIAKRRKDR